MVYQLLYQHIAGMSLTIWRAREIRWQCCCETAENRPIKIDAPKPKIVVDKPVPLCYTDKAALTGPPKNAGFRISHTFPSNLRTSIPVRRSNTAKLLENLPVKRVNKTYYKKTILKRVAFLIWRFIAYRSSYSSTVHPNVSGTRPH